MKKVAEQLELLSGKQSLAISKLDDVMQPSLKE